MAKSFKDEIKIDDKVILNIPIENFFHEDKERRFESKWSDPAEIRAKKGATKEVKFTADGLNKDQVYFDPLKALAYKEKYLMITSQEHHAKQTAKRSKWGSELEKTFQPVPLNVLPKSLNFEEIEYLIRLHRLDDLNRKSKQGTVEIADPEVRSPSPEQVYDLNGRRTNTLDARSRNAMLAEKHYLVEECQKMNVGFLTPFDWKPLKKTKKVYIPEIDDPELNFVALVLGNKGRTQKLLEELSNCRISIRGRQVAGNKRATLEDEEQTHVLIQAERDEDLDKGTELVQKVLKGESLQSIAGGEKKYIKTGYELMAVEAVLRDACENCHEEGHKIWNCPYTFNENLKRRQEYLRNKSQEESTGFTLVQCTTCNSRNHLTRDCPHKNLAAAEQAMNLQMEFFKFKSELNEQEYQLEDVKNVGGSHLTNFITNYNDPLTSRKMIKDK